MVRARGKSRGKKKTLKKMAEDSSFDSTLDELENLFQLATEFVRDLRDLNNEGKLKFYGLFKQVSSLENVQIFEIFMYESICSILYSLFTQLHCT